MARITVWKPHRHVLIHLYKAFISLAHAEACQTRRHGMTIMTTVMSGEQ